MVTPLTCIILAFILGIIAVIVDPEPVATRIKRMPADLMWALVAAFIFVAVVIVAIGH